MNTIQIPEPTSGYRLPNGKLVGTREEYIAEITKDAAARLAGAYVFANASSFARGQATKTQNSVTNFLLWQAVHMHNETLNDQLAAYDAYVAKMAEEAKSKPAEETDVQEPTPAQAEAA